MRSCTAIFDDRPHRSQRSSIQTSRSLPFALTRKPPVGWWRVWKSAARQRRQATSQKK